jgi:hypothetical protein
MLVGFDWTKVVEDKTQEAGFKALFEELIVNGHEIAIMTGYQLSPTDKDYVLKMHPAVKFYEN